MIKYATLGKRNAILTILLLAALVAGCVVLVTHGSARASSTPEPAPVGYHKPTGPELSAAGAAEAAIKAAREGMTATGNIVIRVAHGTFAQVREIVANQGGAAGPISSGKASCFPGLSCTTAEVEQHETELREQDESSAYIVEMTGTSFSPPAGRVEPGASPASGTVETVIVDAHTGFPETRIIGGEGVKLENLGQVTELDATIPSEISVPAIPTVVASESRRQGWGVIVGRVTGLPQLRGIPVILYEGGKASPRDVHRAGRVVTGSRGIFKMTSVVPGRYSIQAGPKCRSGGKKVVVRAGKTTKVALTCTE